MKEILFVTGTRADFGKLKPLIDKTCKQRDKFNIHLFVTGMHLLSKYGKTFDEILKQKYKNIHSFFNQMDATSSQMDIILANTISGLSHYVNEYNIDLIIVHGDRVEALAGALVGSLNNILVAHIEGGEVSGTIDELIRHSVSKVAHTHFVANDEAKKRLIQMGELDESIYVIGSPDIDIMLSKDLPDILKVKKRYRIHFEKYFIFIYHPVTTEINMLESNIDKVVNAIETSGENFVVIYPNNDLGSDIIMKRILKLESNKNFRLLPSMRFEYFLSLMKNSKGLVGNSSAGIREAHVYGISTLNIGTRQNNRFNHKTIISVDENEERILENLKNMPDKCKPHLHFGKGDSANKFIKILNSQSFWNTLIQKRFQDILN